MYFLSTFMANRLDETHHQVNFMKSKIDKGAIKVLRLESGF